MSAEWFESVAEAQRRAGRRLPPSVFKAISAGAERGLTMRDNVEAFDELGFAPHVARVSAERDLSTSVMGLALSLPVLISPTGVQAVHPEGEVAVAHAAAARGTAIGLSSFASQPVEAVTAVNTQTLFQVYWAGTREQMRARLDRAHATGARGLIVTLDWTFSHSRDWGSCATESTRR
jgi:isopentenyl diphosphate isomerase/L-lactate dehydrogenase-like FMN-dependent dehydrogenase